MSLLKIVQWRDLENWSANYYFRDIKSIKFTETKLSSFLKRVKKEIIVDDNVTYKRVTIKTKNQGIYLRDELIGKNIGTKKQYIINSNQFLISKIDARNGAFGIVPNELNNAIITASFLNYEINEEIINPLYLNLFVSTNYFIEICENNSSGTTGRRNVSEELFLNSTIPLPPLNIQEQFVTNYQEKMAKIAQLQQEIEHIEEDSKNYLLSMLGLEKNISRQETKKENLLFFKKWSAIKDWGVESNLINNSNIRLKYNKVFIKDIIDEFNTKSILPVEKEFYYLGLEDICKGGKKYQLKQTSNNEVLSNSLILKENFLYYSKLRPNLKKIFIFNENRKNSYASSELIGMKFKENIDIKFMLSVFLSEIITKQEEKTTGSRMPRVNLTAIKNFQIPLPPLNIQQEISSHLDELQQQIDKKKEEIAYFEILAKSEFEQAVFA